MMTQSKYGVVLVDNVDEIVARETVNTSRPQWVTSENHGDVCHAVQYCLVVDLVVDHHQIGVMKVQGPLNYAKHQELGEMVDA